MLTKKAEEKKKKVFPYGKQASFSFIWQIIVLVILTNIGLEYSSQICHLLLRIWLIDSTFAQLLHQ